MTTPARPHVLCLRPKADFLKVGVEPPALFDITYSAPDAPNIESLLARSSAVVIPAVGPKLAPRLFEGTPVKLVQVTGAGVDRLDLDGMKNLGIAVANVPGGSNDAVAEYVVSTALILLRRLTWAHDQIAAGNYESCRKDLISQLPPGLSGKTVGIVGLGTIGQAVAETFTRFGCRILYHDPALKGTTAAEAIGAQSMDLASLVRTSDVISVHVPLLTETRNLINSAMLTAVKPGAVLINAARGGVIDEAGLVDALMENRLGAAAVDVYSTEPPGSNNPLIAAAKDLNGRLLLTPHIAGITKQAWAQLFRLAWDNVETVLESNQGPRFLV